MLTARVILLTALEVSGKCHGSEVHGYQVRYKMAYRKRTLLLCKCQQQQTGDLLSRVL